MSLESAHHNYLVEVAYTSVLHPTEPDRFVQSFGRILPENLTGWIVFIQWI